MANTTTILFSTKECKYSSNEFLEFAASICLNAVEGTAFNTIAIISSVHASADPRPRFTFRLYESGKEQPIKLFRPLEVLPYWLRQKHKARGEAGSQDATHHTKMSPGLVEGAERYRLLTTMDREDPNGKDFVAARAQEAGKCGQGVGLT